MKRILFFAFGLLIAVTWAGAAGSEEAHPLYLGTPEHGVRVATPILDQDETSHDRFQVETTFTLNSDFDDGRLGDGSSFYSDFSYDHRFLITGRWFFRTGVEYERYDFDGTDNGLPDHLQATYAHLALEYVLYDFPGASIEIDPGFYFQNHITGSAFDIPWKIYSAFPLQKDKLFGVIGVGGGIYQNPVAVPGGGIIWLYSDKLRLLGVIPKPAVIYDANQDWEFQLYGDLVYDSFRTDDVVTPLHKLRVHDAILQYNENRIGAQVSYSGFKPFKITAAAGYTFIRNFDFFRHGVREQVDPAPFFSFAIDAKF